VNGILDGAIDVAAFLGVRFESLAIGRRSALASALREGHMDNAVIVFISESRLFVRAESLYCMHFPTISLPYHAQRLQSPPHFVHKPSSDLPKLRFGARYILSDPRCEGRPHRARSCGVHAPCSLKVFRFLSLRCADRLRTQPPPAADKDTARRHKEGTVPMEPRSAWRADSGIPVVEATLTC
jgi:hypothetical protein